MGLASAVVMGAIELGALSLACPPLTGPSFQVRLQVQSLEKPQYRGTMHCFQSIIKQESVSGVGRGRWAGAEPARRRLWGGPQGGRKPGAYWGNRDFGNGMV